MSTGRRCPEELTVVEEQDNLDDTSNACLARLECHGSDHDGN